MPYKLMVNVAGRTLQFPLRRGDQMIGSSTDADIRIPRPTVSRRHAKLSVSDDEVVIHDLGSSNGTRVSGRRIEGATRLRSGETVHFGSVEASIHRVEAGDLELAVVLPPHPGETEDDAPSSTAPASTVGPAALEAFSLRRLPDLVDLVARDAPMIEVAQAAAAALMEALPCHRVAVMDRSAGTDALVFTVQRGNGDGFPVREDAGGGRSLEAHFASAALAAALRPLVVVAAGLIRSAARSPRSVCGPGPEPPSPEPPRPPSVVREVRSIYSQAALIARSRVSVLIRGESGTGKELLARYLHGASEVAEHALVTLNCAALPRDLLEAELFGVERGVATGVEARPGKFEAAHGGTLFLDEIGDMSLETQASILRVLQESEVYRIGSHQPRPARVRVISATNRDLDRMLEDGTFRRDLYHRIADWVVELPPLRRRQADVPNLAAHFLARACAERGVRAAGISRSAIEALQSYSWPGNVRQLEREVVRAALFIEDGGVLDSGRLDPVIAAAQSPSARGSLRETLEQVERDELQRALAASGGSAADAAARLGLSLSTFYRRLRSLGLGSGNDA